MYKILIDNGITYLFKDNNNIGINDKDIIGFLINNEYIIELINSLDIKEYYVNTRKIPLPYKKITKEQAIFLYEEIIKANKEKEINKNKNH